MNIKTGKNNNLSDKELDAIEFERVDSDYLNKICDTCYRQSMEMASDNDKIQDRITSATRPTACNEKVECAEKGKNYCKEMMQILIDAGFSLEDIGGVFTGQIDPATLKMDPDEREIYKDVQSIGLSKGYDPRKDRGNPGDRAMTNAAKPGDEERNENISARNSNQGSRRRGFRTPNWGDEMSPAQENALRVLEANSKNVFTKMSKSDWLRIGQKAGWIKGAQSSGDAPKTIKVWEANYSDYGDTDEVGMTIAHGEQDEIPIVVDSLLSNPPSEEFSAKSVGEVKERLRKMNGDKESHVRYEPFTGFRFPTMRIEVPGHSDKLFAHWETSGSGSEYPDSVHKWVWIKPEGFSEDELKQIMSGISSKEMLKRNMERQREAWSLEDTNRDMRSPKL